MTPTALFFLPLEANAPSPFTLLSQKISRELSAQPLPPFWLEYRLLVDTSSLLPGALEKRKRRITQILTLSHSPEKTYILTEPEDGTTSDLISVPSGPAAKTFLTMVTAKMQPLWTARSEFRIDKGTSIELGDNDVSSVRVGELRATMGLGAGKTRGIVIELNLHEDKDEEDESDVVARETTVRAALDATFRGSGVSMNNVKLVTKFSSKQKGESEHADLIRMYAELTRLAAPSTQK